MTVHRKLMTWVAACLLALAAAPAPAQTIQDSPGISYGTWLPAFSLQTVGDLSVAYVTQAGSWVRTGSVCTVSYRILFTPTYTTASGNARVITLPVLGLASAAAGSGFLNDITGVTSVTGLVGETPQGTGGIQFVQSNYTLLTATNFPTGVQAALAGSYTYRC